MTIAEIRARHTRCEVMSGEVLCDQCDVKWPCDTVRVLEELDHAEKDYNNLCHDQELLEGKLGNEQCDAHFERERAKQAESKLATLEAAVGQLPKLSALELEMLCEQDFIDAGLKPVMAQAVVGLLRLRHELK